MQGRLNMRKSISVIYHSNGLRTDRGVASGDADGPSPWASRRGRAVLPRQLRAGGLAPSAHAVEGWGAVGCGGVWWGAVGCGRAPPRHRSPELSGAGVLGVSWNRSAGGNSVTPRTAGRRGRSMWWTRGAQEESGSSLIPLRKAEATKGSVEDSFCGGPGGEQGLGVRLQLLQLRRRLDGLGRRADSGAGPAWHRQRLARPPLLSAA